MASTQSDPVEGAAQTPRMFDEQMRIISIDGGPSASLQSRIIAYIEKQRPGFLARTSVFAGTSDGSFVALFLAAKAAQGMSGEPLASACIEFTNQILHAFSPTCCSKLGFLTGLRPITPVVPLQRLMASTFQVPSTNQPQTLGDLTSQGVVVCSFNKTRWEPAVFQSFDNRDAHALGRTLADVALSSSAFPLLIAIHKSPFDGCQYLDGAFVANSPTQAAVASCAPPISQRLAVSPGPETSDHIRVLSLGARQADRQQHGLCGLLQGILNAPDLWNPTAVSWGVVQWALANPLETLERLFLANSQETDREARNMLGLTRYRRFQPEMKELDFALGSVIVSTEKLIQALDAQADELIASGEVDRCVIAWLDGVGWTTKPHGS